jgi:hypothetical protein
VSGQQQFPLVPPPGKALLIVVKNVECVEGEECPSLPDSEDFLMSFFLGNNPDPEIFLGSSDGTVVTLEPEVYAVIEDPPNPEPPGLNYAGRTTNDNCGGFDGATPIQAGEVRTEFTNFYASEQIPQRIAAFTQLFQH